jgi:ABC-2 type transport system ATP-binding protein
VLVLAEPFAECEEATIALLSRLIREQASEGVAILVLAHDAAHLPGVCDVIYRLDKGRITETLSADTDQDTQLPFMIPAHTADRVSLVAPGDILYAVAQDDNANLHTIDGVLPTRFTLSELEDRLARSGFFRAHRSYLVNLQHVKEVIPYTRDSYSLKLKDAEETQIPLSKTAARELRDLLGF